MYGQDLGFEREQDLDASENRVEEQNIALKEDEITSTDEPDNSLEILPEEQVEQQEVKGTIEDLAHASLTVGDFRTRLNSLEPDESGSAVERARNNINQIPSRYDNFLVVTNLSVGGQKAAGAAKVGEPGTAQIDADHLATISIDELAEEVHRTLRHEQEHLDQVMLDEGFIVIDPKTGQKIDPKILFEGGAVSASVRELGRSEDRDAWAKDNNPEFDKYKKGFNLYQTYGADTIDSHIVRKKGGTGDKVSLQADLAQKAGVQDEDRLLDLAQKAGFSDQEQEELLEKSQE